MEKEEGPEDEEEEEGGSANRMSRMSFHGHPALRRVRPHPALVRLRPGLPSLPPFQPHRLVRGV